MSFTLDAKTTVDEAIEALEKLGAVIKWEGAKPAVGTTVELFQVEIDEGEAAMMLENRGWHIGIDPEPIDSAGLCDFIVTVARGDAITAGALAARLFEFDSNRDAAELALSQVRRFS